jgi:hypothetical protein
MKFRLRKTKIKIKKIEDIHVEKYGASTFPNSIILILPNKK